MHSVEAWLDDLGLGKYAEAFAANDVDFRALPHLDGADLQELGVSLGHRKVLLAAIAALDAAPVATAPRVRDGSAGEASPDIRLLTVFFCDLVGSTSLSGRLAPEDMHELLTAYQDTVAGAVTRFGGHVAKFLGDGVLAYFGWPMAYEDHAERAIRAGLAAVAAVERIRAPDGEALRARLGIATGRVVVGDLEGGGVLERGQIAGETPNLAARLQAVAEPGQIVIADATRGLAGQSFEFADLGPTELKGFASPVRAFQVRSERQIESRFDAAHGASLSHFVGRDSELGLLRARWELARAGQGQTVFLTGELGIGKSRLLETLIETLRDERVELIRLQCSPYHTASAFYPIIHRLSRLAGFSRDDDADARAAKLEAMLVANGEDSAEVGPIYVELLALDLADRFPPADLPPAQRRELTVRTLVRRLFLSSARAPTLVVLEDAHWIDPSTNEVLSEIASAIHAAPVCVLVVHRPEWTAEWAVGRSDITQVTVGRLTKAQMAELIESVLGSAPPGLVERIADRTDGVPLFVEELTRAILESGEGANEAIEIPASLQGALMARLDRLPSAAKEVVQIASVLGREFDRALLEQVSPVSSEELDAALNELVAAQLLVRGGLSRRSLVFRHALIQDTAYQSMLGRRRRLHHQTIAETIIRADPLLAKTQPEVVARHFAEAGRDDLALPFWTQAGRRALERFANYEAVEHFASALAIAEAWPMGPDREAQLLAARLMYAEALNEAGRLMEALTQFTLAAAEARSLGDSDSLVRVALGYDFAQFLAGLSLEPSVALLTEARGGIPADDERRDCLLTTRLARAHTLLGDPQGGAELNQRATAVARRLGDRASLFNLLVDRFLTPRRIGSAKEAQALAAELDEIIQLAEAAPGDEARMRAHSLNIYVSAEMGERARVDGSVAALTEVGDVRQRLHVQWIARHGAAMLAILDGRFGAAEALAAQGLEIGRRTHGAQVEGVYGIQMFSIRREQGRLADVAPMMRQVIDTPDGATWMPGFVLLAADMGYREPALKRLRALGETGFDLPTDATRSASLSYVAEAAAMLGDTASAERLYELLSIYEHMTITAGIVSVCYGAASRHLGLLADVLGDHQRAERHFEHALEMNARIGARPWLAHTQADFAQMLRGRGGKAAGRAKTLAKAAWATAEELDMVRLKQKLQSTVR